MEKNYKRRFYIAITIMIFAAILFIGYFFLGSYANEIREQALDDISIQQTSENKILLWNVENGVGQRIGIDMCSSTYVNYVREVCGG